MHYSLHQAFVLFIVGWLISALSHVGKYPLYQYLYSDAAV